MQNHEQFDSYEGETPLGLEHLPDEMKPIAYKNQRYQNFDIILNKFFNNGELTDIELQQLNEHEKIILEEVKRKAETKTKRPDEYQKLFFKKAFKYAEHSFFKKNKKNRSRRMSQFYHHHFDCLVRTLKIPLNNFYHPEKKTKPGFATGQKSFNTSYVKTILKSLTFRKVCLQYHCKFRQDCRTERNKKISTFTASLFSMIDKNNQDRAKLIRFLQSSKCKIPWTDRDIEQAHKRAAEDLDDYSVEQEEKKLTFQFSIEGSDIFGEGDNCDREQEEIELLQQKEEQSEENRSKTMIQDISCSELSSQNGSALKMSLDLLKI